MIVIVYAHTAVNRQNAIAASAMAGQRADRANLNDVLTTRARQNVVLYAYILTFANL